MSEEKDEIVELFTKISNYDGGCKDCPFRIKDCGKFLSNCIIEEVDNMKSMLRIWKKDLDKNENRTTDQKSD